MQENKPQMIIEGNGSTFRKCNVERQQVLFVKELGRTAPPRKTIVRRTQLANESGIDMVVGVQWPWTFLHP